MESLSKYRKCRSIPRQGVKRRRSQETKDQACTPEPCSNAFLKHQFLPLVGTLPIELRSRAKVEREFFASLSNLSNLYQFAPINVRDKVYPDNIRCAFREAQVQLKLQHPDLGLFIVQDETHTACLHTGKGLDTGMTLYYIPVRPLWDLLQDGRRKPMANMLLSLYAYLYQLAGIPYFREGNSYLSGTYEMMEDWIDELRDEGDSDYYQEQKRSMQTLQFCGDKLLKQIRHPYHLQQFTDKVRLFVPSNAHEEAVHQVALAFWELYQTYGGSSVADRIYDGFLEPQEEERIYMEQYLSFYWDCNDNLYQSLFETVNADLQEKSVTDEPLALQPFDNSQREILPHTLDFESRLLDLIGDLTSLI